MNYAKGIGGAYGGGGYRDCSNASASGSGYQGIIVITYYTPETTTGFGFGFVSTF